MARQQASAADEPPIAPAARLARRLIRFVREVDPRLFDALLALVLGAAGLATILGRSDGTADFRSDDLLGAVLVLGQTLPLALRRLSPMGVLAFVNAALVAHAAMGYEVVQAGTFGSLVSVYGAASVSSGRGTGLVAGVVAAGLVGFFATSRGDWSATDVAATSGTWAVAWFAGTFIRMNSRLYEESQRRARDLQTILEMSRAVTSTLDLRQLYETALDRLGELIPYTGAAIQLVTDEGPRQVATRRPPEAGPGGLSAPRFYETGIWRRLWSGEHVVIPDVRGDEPFAVEYRSIIEGDIARSPMSYFRSWMAVPLMLKDRSLGSLSLVHAEPGFFRPEHVELASTVANHIAIAIENARLFEEGSKKAHQLETLLDTSRAIASTLDLQQLFEVTMDRLRDLIPYTGGGIGLELDGRQLIGATRRPGADTSPIARRPGWLESKTMRSLRAGTPIVIDDLRGDEPLAVDFRSWLLADIAETPLAYARSLMAVPLIVRGAAVGDVSLTHERPGYFTHEHVELVQTVANHLAIAIENARLFEESSRKARELGALLELSRSMASTLDLEELFEVTLDRLQDLVPHSGGSISLRTQEGLRYSTTRRPSGDESLLQRRPGWSESNYMKGISRGMPVLIDDLRGDEPLAVEYRSWLACDIEESPVAYARSMLAVPLVVKGMAFGDVTLAHERPAYFRKEHAELVQTVANHLAIAIENARLFDETSRKAAEVAALLQANEVLHRSLSLPEVFQALVDVSVDVLRVDMSAVLLRDAPDRPLRVRAQRGFDPDKIEAARDEVAALDLQLPETGSQWVVSDTLGDPRASQPLTVGLDMRATLQVPLRIGNALGVFVFGYRAPRSWSADEVRLCQSLAERASAAIENALLFEQSESHARELEALYRADEKLFSSLDLDAVLQNLADISVDILGAEKSLVLMADDVGAGLRPKAWRNMSPALVAYFSREHPYVGNVRSPDGEFEDLDASHPDHSFLSAEGVRAGMEVAIVGEGRRYGSFAVAYSRRHSFSTEEKRVLGALAARAAVAIRNAALFARAQQAASLEERQRLARELHDSVSQALYGIALGARTARTQLDREPEKAAEPLNYVLSLAEAGLAEMRALIFELRPESLESEGLVAALEKQVSATRARHGLEVQASLCAEPDVAVEVKEAAYRIAQEALHNVVKHSQARSVRLVLAAEGDALRLTVADDGRGFDPDSDFPGHMGLRSMRERAERAGGTLTIDAAPGRGATVTAVFPLP